MASTKQLERSKLAINGSSGTKPKFEPNSDFNDDNRIYTEHSKKEAEENKYETSGYFNKVLTLQKIPTSDWSIHMISTPEHDSFAHATEALLIDKFPVGAGVTNPDEETTPPSSNKNSTLTEYGDFQEALGYSKEKGIENIYRKFLDRRASALKSLTTAKALISEFEEILKESLKFLQKDPKSKNSVIRYRERDYTFGYI